MKAEFEHRWVGETSAVKRKIDPDEAAEVCVQCELNEDKGDGLVGVTCTPFTSSRPDGTVVTRFVPENISEVMLKQLEPACGVPVSNIRGL